MSCQGRVVVTAPDSDDVRCLDLKTGALLWKSGRGEDDVYLAGAFGDRVVLVGQNACRALALKDGHALWTYATGMPAGLGAACGAYYYLPLRNGTLFALHLQSPLSSLRITGQGHTLGNLLFHEDGLWSQTATRLTAFPQVGPRLKRLTELLAQSPRDSGLLEERGRLRVDEGDAAGAVADLLAAQGIDATLKSNERHRSRLFNALTQYLERRLPRG